MKITFRYNGQEYEGDEDALWSVAKSQGTQLIKLPDGTLLQVWGYHGKGKQGLCLYSLTPVRVVEVAAVTSTPA